MNSNNKLALEITGTLAMVGAFIYSVSICLPLAINEIASVDLDNDLERSLNEAFNISSDESCYYVDPDKRLDVTYMEPESNIVIDAVKDATPFIESSKPIKHDLGSLPVISKAPCEYLRPAFSLSADDAQIIASQAVQAISDPLQNVSLATVTNRYGPLITRTVSAVQP